MAVVSTPQALRAWVGDLVSQGLPTLDAVDVHQHAAAPGHDHASVGEFNTHRSVE